VKASRILKELKKEGIVVPHQSAKNKRDIKLLLNDDNPFVSLPNELKEFKQFFYPLVDSATKVPIIYPDSFKVLFECFAIFFELMRMLNYRAFFVWSKQIKDRETLSKLFKVFYSEMASLHLEVLGKIEKVLKEEELEDEFLSLARDAVNQLLIPDDISFHESERTFEDFRLKKQATPVLKHLLRVRKKIFGSQFYTKEELLREKQNKQILSKRKQILNNKYGIIRL
jgi:hypothetical protein